MARQTGHKVFIVRFSDSHCALIRAHSIADSYIESFMHFMDRSGATIQSLRTDKIIDITTRRFTNADIKRIFPTGSIYVEKRGNFNMLLLPAP